MKVITDTKELDNAIKQLREEAKNKGYDFFRFYLVGEQLIRDTAAKDNFVVNYWKGLDGLFADADNKVQGLSLSGGSELKFVDVAFIEGPVYSNYVLVDSIFKVVKYKDYLLSPLKFSSDKTYHFEFLETPIKIKITSSSNSNLPSFVMILKSINSPSLGAKLRSTNSPSFVVMFNM